MFDNLKNRKVKVVWKDKNINGENKVVRGILKDTSNSFVLIIQDGSPIYLNVNSILSIKEKDVAHPGD